MNRKWSGLEWVTIGGTIAVISEYNLILSWEVFSREYNLFAAFIFGIGLVVIAIFKNRQFYVDEYEKGLK